MRYPQARRLDLVERLHGHDVPDPYRWLEDPADPDCEAWSQAQDALVRGRLDSLPGRDKATDRLRRLLPGSVSVPGVYGEHGERLFFLRRTPEQEFPVLYVQDDAEANTEPRALVDTAAIDPTLATTLDGAAVSKEGDRLAYLLSHGGREESALHVLDVATGEDVAEPVLLGRGGDVAWLAGGEELVIVRRLADGQIPEGEEQFHRRVWRHRVGADPSTDVLLFGEGRDKTTYYGVTTSHDGRWLLITAALGTAPRNDLYLIDTTTGEQRVVIEGADAQTSGHVAADGRLYLVTDLDAPKRRLVVADPAAPDKWTDLIAEGDDLLEDYTVTNGAVVAVHMHDVVSRITVRHKETGAVTGEVGLPGLGVATVSSASRGGDDAWIGYSDYLTPSLVLRHHVPTGQTTTWATAPGAVETPGLSVKQVFVDSKDGARIPMFVIARDDVALDGDNPTILYGYGGFNVAMTPGYSNNVLAWAEAGGVYAVANLRGGSEYGEEWHRDGMRANKQHVFDDYIAGSEWLIAQGYTSPARLGISGGSNGGLLVGAALTQRPDLYRAVVCSAPLLDMVRYEQFGLGQTWNDEYGRADDPGEFEWLYSYSPYHRVSEGTAYPAVLFTVFEGDTRVDPLHARKLCAALQQATSSDPDERPVLIRRETAVGHGARAVSRTIGLQADTFSFLADQLGLAL
jgi:prolyl oligopeptidase